jgi:two-component system response regulator DesR
MTARLAHDPGIRVVGELHLDDKTAERAADHWPHVVVIWTELMVGQILPTLRELQTRIAGCKILILADPKKPGMLPPRRRARWLSFLVKDAPPELLAKTIQRVAAGERVIHPRLTAAVLATGNDFSTRELEVLGLAAGGAPVAEIAHRLYLSRGTVRNYLSAVITKTGARNRIDAIRIVREDGWLA